jgi:hypothetical protein
MKKMSPFLIVIVSLLLISLAGYVLTWAIPIESFFGAQGGEMVQLAAGHVPTRADLEDEKEEARQVEREMVEMTGAPF